MANVLRSCREEVEQRILQHVQKIAAVQVGESLALVKEKGLAGPTSEERTKVRIEPVIKLLRDLSDS